MEATQERNIERAQYFSQIILDAIVKDKAFIKNNPDKKFKNELSKKAIQSILAYVGTPILQGICGVLAIQYQKQEKTDRLKEKIIKFYYPEA